MLKVSSACSPLKNPQKFLSKNFQIPSLQNFSFLSDLQPGLTTTIYTSKPADLMGAVRFTQNRNPENVNHKNDSFFFF